MSPETGNVIEVEDLTVEFRKREGALAAVNGVNFSLARGEVLTILGESGSGKSVTLKAMMGLLPAYAYVTGQARLNGKNILALPPADLAKVRGGEVSMIFQEPMAALDPVYTIGEQIAETIVQHEGISDAAAMQRALELLERVSIPSAARRLKNYPHEMSGGMRQRAMIALALACSPSVLLADEPTTALDVTVQKQILQLVRELQRNSATAILFITHDLGVVAKLCDHVAVMHGGRVLESAPAAQLFANPTHDYTRALFAATPRFDRPAELLQPIPAALTQRLAEEARAIDARDA